MNDGSVNLCNWFYRIFYICHIIFIIAYINFFCMDICSDYMDWSFLYSYKIDESLLLREEYGG